VVGIRRDPRADAGHVDAVHADLSVRPESS